MAGVGVDLARCGILLRVNAVSVVISNSSGPSRRKPVVRERDASIVAARSDRAVPLAVPAIYDGNAVSVGEPYGSGRTSSPPCPLFQ